MSQHSIPSPTYLMAQSSGKRLLAYIKCNNTREKDYPKQSLFLNYQALLNSNWEAAEETCLAMNMIRSLFLYLNAPNILTDDGSWEDHEFILKKEILEPGLLCA
ncbi:hypothetical protein BTUL_0228g00120 [Botrytis tulipae]|uniref:Uncharacterized protein n=1 Tax=Botrytis tulipae TaxID=87230 RepID=A0A4Z1EF80_9HELO|nr:hypothetical protein BTUL_0228g00120 [Botrytis tulipae]